MEYIGRLAGSMSRILAAVTISYLIFYVKCKVKFNTLINLLGNVKKNKIIFR